MTTNTTTLSALPIDHQKGTWGITLFIMTEAALFAVLFFAYFFLATQNPHWPIGEAPKLTLALIMTGILLSSSFTLYWSERSLKHEKPLQARMGLLITFLLGLLFLTLQIFEYRDHLKTLTPHSNAYGSIFYTITSFHGAHVVLGVLMLLFVLFSQVIITDRPPYQAFHNASLYWHFVDIVWLLIIAILYVSPKL